MDTFEKLDQIRIKNIISILNVFRSQSETSVALLSEKTGIGVTTVKKYTEQGLLSGMFYSNGFAPSTGGRNARRYSLNKDYGHYLCFILDDNELHYYVVDFHLNTVTDESVEINISNYLNEVERITGEKTREYKTIKSICLSLPCIVKNGKIIDWYYNQKLNGTNVEELLNEKYNIPVVIQNDMKLTVYSRSFKEQVYNPTIATVQFGHNGLGVAELVNGEIHEGISGFAGEVGFLNWQNKSLNDISFPARIINALIVFINPEKIIFYNSKRQNDFEKIFNSATANLPSYAIPKYVVADAYIPDILDGLLKETQNRGLF